MTQVRLGIRSVCGRIQLLGARDRFACWKMDTQLVESVNSTIRLVIQAAPHVGLELLSARVCIRRNIAGGRLDVSEVIDEAVQWGA